LFRHRSLLGSEPITIDPTFVSISTRCIRPQRVIVIAAADEAAQMTESQRRDHTGALGGHKTSMG
jgi:hypothetical protein